MGDIHEFFPDDDGICTHCDQDESAHTIACMCEYGGRECCPIHITEHDKREWEASDLNDVKPLFEIDYTKVDPIL